ncbi:MAG: hypothetical protein M0027_16460 [Candidatus Dormibacteraeota bacterium]|jgi:uncharacterized RDD family membrane protein YckC|nr:hypothetical protein [Candidatus Dormibacteraeota bacterium]
MSGQSPAPGQIMAGLQVVDEKTKWVTISGVIVVPGMMPGMQFVAQQSYQLTVDQARHMVEALMRRMAQIDGFSANGN